MPRKASSTLGNIKYASRGLRRENDEDKRRALRKEKSAFKVPKTRTESSKGCKGLGMTKQSSHLSATKTNFRNKAQIKNSQGRKESNH